MGFYLLERRTVLRYRKHGPTLRPYVVLCYLHMVHLAVTPCHTCTKYGIGKLTIAKIHLTNHHLLDGIVDLNALTADFMSHIEQFVFGLCGFDNFRAFGALRAHLLFSCSKPEHF